MGWIIRRGSQCRALHIIAESSERYERFYMPTPERKAYQARSSAVRMKFILNEESRDGRSTRVSINSDNCLKPIHPNALLVKRTTTRRRRPVRWKVHLASAHFASSRVRSTPMHAQSAQPVDPLLAYCLACSLPGGKPFNHNSAYRGGTHLHERDSHLQIAC